MEVAVGVDCHKSTLAAAAVDQLGRQLDAKEVMNDGEGHVALLAWIQGLRHTRVIGIEGVGKFGSALAHYLSKQGETVQEVSANLACRERRRQHSKGKSDAVDATAIARVVARGEGLPWTPRSAALEDLRLLSDYREQLKRARNQLANRVHKDLVHAHPGYEKRVPKLTSKKDLSAVITLLRGNRSVRADLMRRRIADIRRIDAELARLNGELKALLGKAGSTLSEIEGVGAVTAAKILGVVGDVRRIKSKAAFAQLTGTAPLPASSGAVQRHRLNRGGHRQLNYALHYLALSQYRRDPRTKAYVERRRSEGKSFNEAMRCLKRHLANVVYRQMLEDALRAEPILLTT